MSASERRKEKRLREVLQSSFDRYFPLSSRCSFVQLNSEQINRRRNSVREKLSKSDGRGASSSMESTSHSGRVDSNRFKPYGSCKLGNSRGKNIIKKRMKRDPFEKFFNKGVKLFDSSEMVGCSTSTGIPGYGNVSRSQIGCSYDTEPSTSRTINSETVEERKDSSLLISIPAVFSEKASAEPKIVIKTPLNGVERDKEHSYADAQEQVQVMSESVPFSKFKRGVFKSSTPLKAPQSFRLVPNVDNSKHLLEKEIKQLDSKKVLSELETTRLQYLRCLFKDYDVDVNVYVPPDIKIKIFKGISIFVDVWFDGTNISKCVEEEVTSMGARVARTINTKVRYIIFKEGQISVYIKARRKNIPLVSANWVEACKKARSIIDHTNFRPIKMEKYDSILPFEMIPRRRLIVLSDELRARFSSMITSNRPPETVTSTKETKPTVEKNVVEGDDTNKNNKDKDSINKDKDTNKDSSDSKESLCSLCKKKIALESDSEKVTRNEDVSGQELLANPMPVKEYDTSGDFSASGSISDAYKGAH